jgi:two-component sensor histidine kinase
MIELTDYDEGIRYNLLAVRTLEHFKDSSTTASQAYFNLAFAYGKLKDERKNVLFYMSKANQIAKKNNDADAVIITGLQMVDSYRYMQMYSKARSMLAEIAKSPVIKKYQIEYLIQQLQLQDILREEKQAKMYFQQLQTCIKGRDTSVNTVQAAIRVSLHHLYDTKQYAVIRNELPQLFKLPFLNKRPSFHLNLEQIAFKIDSAQGNFQSALYHFQEATKLINRRLENEYDIKTSKMRVDYDLQQKDQNIAYQAKSIHLLTQENQLQSSAIKNQELIRNLSIAAAGLLALLLGLGYHYYLIKKRNNLSLEEKQLAINAQNASLRQLVQEKEWLLKEIHHRVKNNLQIVISLLNSQLYNIKDTIAKDVIRESQHRMHSISLIHQRLYQNNNMADISMYDYIRDLAGYLQESFGCNGKIDFKIDIDNIRLDVSQAVPLGLILNEAVTNSIKYAFNDFISRPTIFIKMKIAENDKLEVEVADNGTGWSPEFNPLSGGTLGMNLITGLTKQLKGQLSFSCEDGVCIKITLPFSAAIDADKPEELLQYA